MATASPMTTFLSREEYDGMSIPQLADMLVSVACGGTVEEVSELLATIISHESDHTYDQAYEDGYEAGMSAYGKMY